MQPEKESGGSDLEPASSFWYPLKESNPNESGFTSVGKVAWFPSQMPNGFEIAPEGIEKAVVAMGYTGIVLGRLDNKPERNAAIGSVSGNGEATFAQSVTKTEPAADSDVSNEVLLVYLDFDTLLAKARAWARNNSSSREVGQDYAAHLLDQALKHEMAQVAFKDLMMIMMKDLLVNFNGVVYYIFFILSQHAMMQGYEFTPQEKQFIEFGTILGFPIAYLCSLAAQAVEIAFKRYKEDLSRIGGPEEITQKKNKWREQWGIEAESLLELITFLFYFLYATIHETQKYPRLHEIIRLGLTAGKLKAVDPQFLRASKIKNVS